MWRSPLSMVRDLEMPVEDVSLLSKFTAKIEACIVCVRTSVSAKKQRRGGWMRGLRVAPQGKGSTNTAKNEKATPNLTHTHTHTHTYIHTHSHNDNVDDKTKRDKQGKQDKHENGVRRGDATPAVPILSMYLNLVSYLIRRDAKGPLFRIAIDCAQVLDQGRVDA